MVKSRFNDISLIHNPVISVIIPAFNEEKLIKRTIMSVIDNSYENKEIIVVNDGSTDSTLEALNEIKYYHPNIKIVNQKNSGKSRAINNAVKNYSHGELIMILDSDSVLSPDAIQKMVMHFKDSSIIAMATNVKISKFTNFIEYAQLIEYLISHELKGSEEILKLEYIIGGIGSTFRKSAMKQVGYYDTDSVTEDIDFTLKLISHYGNKVYKEGFAEDVIVYTEPVHNLRQLIKQRYRWKYGRFKALYKHHSLFFNSDYRFYKNLTFWKIPKVLLEEAYMLFDPFLTIFVLYSIWHSFSWISCVSILFLYGTLLGSAILSDSILSLRSKKVKIIICLSMPFTYIFLQIINFVDYISLIRCIKNCKKILNKKDKTSSWSHVDR
ncbi:glycosyltransferase [Apilactobacillus ozensis]|uniref:glycosyltransferase n=1 Tax=Apilactobacillus ozensis TaxID=866801 RepID=UPI00138F999D|nr:glycosyltransferase [Apilactobacillus ozensis]